jgi:Trypsin-like peptidase domain
MAVTFHIATYPGESGPVDFRIKPKFTMLASGVSNVIVKSDTNVEEVYLLTCAHVVYRDNEENNPVLIQPYASTKWVKGTLVKCWDFDEAPDLALVAVDWEELEATLSVKISTDELIVGKLDPGNPIGPAKNMKRRIMNRLQVRSRDSVNQDKVRNPHFAGLFEGKSKKIDKMRKISGDILSAGDSGSAVFDEEFNVLYGLFVLDDETDNYINELYDEIGTIDKYFNS